MIRITLILLLSLVLSCKDKGNTVPGVPENVQKEMQGMEVIIISNKLMTFLKILKENEFEGTAKDCVETIFDEKEFWARTDLEKLEYKIINPDSIYKGDKTPLLEYSFDGGAKRLTYQDGSVGDLEKTKK